MKVINPKILINYGFKFNDKKNTVDHYIVRYNDKFILHKEGVGFISNKGTFYKLKCTQIGKYIDSKYLMQQAYLFNSVDEIFKYHLKQDKLNYNEIIPMFLSFFIPIGDKIFLSDDLETTEYNLINYEYVGCGQYTKMYDFIYDAKWFEKPLPIIKR